MILLSALPVTLNLSMASSCVPSFRNFLFNLKKIPAARSLVRLFRGSFGSLVHFSSGSMSSTFFLCTSLDVSGCLSITGFNISVGIFNCTRGSALAHSIILNVSWSVIFASAARFAIAAEVWPVASLRWSNRVMQCSITSLSFLCCGSLLVSSNPEIMSSSESETCALSGFSDSHRPTQDGSLIEDITVPQCQHLLLPCQPCLNHIILDLFYGHL